MRLKNTLPKFLLAGVSLFFTAYAFLNTYEVVFNKDIAVANSIHAAVAQGAINATIEQFDIKPEADPDQTNSVYKKLNRVMIPALDSNLYLEEKRVVNHQYYIHPSMGHVIGLNKDDEGVTVDYLIYTERSWRTFPTPNQIEQGMEVRVFHDGNNLSLFKVAEKKVLPMDAVFVPSKSDKRQIVLLVEDPKNNVYYAFSLEMKG
jgi:hypothetical protein